MKLHLLFICLISACLQPKSSQLKNNDRLSRASNKLGSYEIYAHRGDFKFYAENTKQAFIDAFENFYAENRAEFNFEYRDCWSEECWQLPVF